MEGADRDIVVTVWSVAILRMSAFPVSATKMLPVLSTTRLRGWLKSTMPPALLPKPAMPAVPATVVTAPLGAMARIVPLPVSAT